ncbi:MAG: hypothetical protein GTN89_12000 [Acidobacteria bacterium]|nr:hypothetical protein [Acidobacteriota bacterium]NIM61027.1 hypothetical protein [Acidobacteriota bacterium]NIO59995.1 hypothetical protein [Acidobacteriota bacterium]NIQ31067.1 hypothetical protein [Acidobacteriota bacterium]NIQ86195.1 hypothetical protein [Acidobacteriota bacterium]
MRSHLFHMLLFAGLLSAYFAVLLRDDKRERIRFGLLLWGGLVGGALALAFLMAP